MGINLLFSSIFGIVSTFKEFKSTAGILIYDIHEEIKDLCIKNRQG